MNLRVFYLYKTVGFGWLLINSYPAFVLTLVLHFFLCHLRLNYGITLFSGK